MLLSLTIAVPAQAAGPAVLVKDITAAVSPSLDSSPQDFVAIGTLAGTALVQDIAPFSANSSPSSFTPAGTYIFFSANDGSTGQELWAAPLTAFPRLLYLPIVQR